MNEKEIRPEEAAAALGVTTATIYNWMKSGKFPRPVTVGACKKYLEAQRTEIDQAYMKVVRLENGVA